MSLCHEPDCYFLFLYRLINITKKPGDRQTSYSFVNPNNYI